MFKLCIFLLLTFTSISPLAMANTHADGRAKILDAHSNGIFTSIRVALHGLSQNIASLDLSEQDAHELFSSTAKITPGVRSFIYIEADGMLKFDGFTYPSPEIDLSERGYFQAAKTQKEGVLNFGKVLIGKSSTLPFVPISTSIHKNGKFNGVLVAIASPNSFLAPIDSEDCLFCVSAIIHANGETLAQMPAQFDLQPFKKMLDPDTRSSEGVVLLQSGSLPAKASWIRNSDFPVISIFLELVR